ncbi:uncharacterized protein LOC131035819 isoform X2 [Cryptomeria japonica]|uniref:uncharacterized protein LOC131035819 isoform X2 n=1 Tax=Cryptomeria japonica TaxID=3369 RepID=UPI0027DA8E6A|nr:uncharacterized protein LOC131035819 isoform X2 [Cryptomeria japonica]
MDNRGRFIFDLNEPPNEEDESDVPHDFHTPAQLQPSAQVNLSEGLLQISNECSFTHASFASGFQPFVRVKEERNVQESMGSNSIIDLNDQLKEEGTQDSVVLNRSLHSVVSGFKEEDKKNAQSTLSKHSGFSSATVLPLQVEDAVQKECVIRDEQINDREEGEWSDNEETAQQSSKNEAVSCEARNVGIKEDRMLLDLHAKQVVEEGKVDPEVVEKGPKEFMTNIDGGNETLYDSSTNMEVDNKIQCEELSNIGNTDSSHVIAKSPSIDKVYDNDKQQSAISDGLDDIKVEVPQANVQLNNSIKASGSGLLNKTKGHDGQNEARPADYLSKKRKIDHQKEAKLGKKRDRQVKLLDLEDVRKAAPIKTPTSRRQSTVFRNVNISNDSPGDRQGLPLNKDQRLADSSSSEGGTVPEFQDNKRTEQNSEECLGIQTSFSEKLSRVNSAQWSKRGNSNLDSPAEGLPPHVPRQNSWKQGMEQKHTKGYQLPNWKMSSAGGPVRESLDQRYAVRKHLLPSKKQVTSNMSYQDTSVERLHREVTSEKFWQRSDEMELQCVPGTFESAEDYVRVFEPLLFEECRAQLHSTWEELCETASREANIMVRIKSVDRRERGWYDVTVLPVHEYKWTFKEGDVGVISTPKPGTGAFKKSSSGLAVEDEVEVDVAGRVAGTVRRYMPVDTRDPYGAILHFYVGDSIDDSRADDDHIVMKLQKKGMWCLTVLGSLSTIQREYVALHSFRRLNAQMQKAILNPRPEHFPNNEEQPPAMPECFTPNFIEHLHRSFNGPQLAAIQWAAMHTAAGTNGVGSARRQEPWPFTLVQGPPGTGKTHTVWGMLNVIHLVQYQHYYGALLKKLAPESYRQANNNANSVDGTGTGSIDDVLQSMDRTLFRMLPKLCPKPRMLVCAPSNAATDELLQRVLDRGFIDGEMKVYRPDVARVGVDSQNRAAQAVSVERRTEILLGKGREEVIGYMHQLQSRELNLSQKISGLQRELSVTAAAGRSQGTVGVDPDVLVARDHNRDQLLQNLAAVVEERDKVLVELSRLFILESRFRPGGEFNMEEARSNLEASFANEAEIVFTTVSSSGRKLFQRLAHGFDMVVIDEAAQASEVGVLPPLSLGAARCVLVGDPQQLPATVISQAAGMLHYSRSLFERFQQAGCPTLLLSVQYRMHPQIRDFPSRYFYQNRLSDSESVSRRPDEIYYKDPLLRPYLFYDITHGRESHRGGSVSYQNVHEAQFALQLYEHLQRVAKSACIKVSVGIITPYKLQLKCLQREFDSVLKSDEGKGLYINTVDAFQGQERDVIIMSCVRASNHGVGFVADVRRMNVALTRARRALWVMGNAAALKQSSDWSALIEDSKSRGCFMDMESLPRDFLVVKQSSIASSQARVLPHMRPPRLGGPIQRQPDAHGEGPGVWMNDDRSNSVAKNGAYRNSRANLEHCLEDFGSASEKSRDAWQQSLARADRVVPEDQRGNDSRVSIRSDRIVGKYV